ncbi:hypothetical protein Tco_0011157 [Tanacetum coccineum]
MADKEKKSTMKGFETNDQGDYYSGITSITVNGKNAMELRQENSLMICTIMPLVDKLGVVVFPISLVGNA